jgi:NAD(P)-dependent dehydrogenase (short-subunit alcohol dehydrogenase family)
MKISLQNEVVVITGGAVRLGRAMALECARAGASVAITYRRSEAEAQETLSQMQKITPDPGRATFVAIRAEVTQSTMAETLAQQVQSTLGTPTALINSAAIFRRTPFEVMNEQDFDDHIAANLKGPYLLCKRFGDIFLQNGRGHIINFADIYGLRPLKNYVPYCLSKAGVVMLTEALALALAPTVRVNCICPGTVMMPSEVQGEDDELEQLLPKIPLQRLGTPEEIALSVVFLLGGPQFITGAILPVDGAQRLR